MFCLQEFISIKQGRGHPKNGTNWYKMDNAKFCDATNCIIDIEI